MTREGGLARCERLSQFELWQRAGTRTDETRRIQ